MNTPAKKVVEYPPAPVPGSPVKVPFDQLPEYLAHHGLEIVGWDDRKGLRVKVKGEVSNGQESE